MSNVAKLKKKAAEFEQKKQFDKALALYVQILDELQGHEEADDVALYNRVGDLMLRQGNVSDAVNYYERAVDLYTEGGFFNNAIALCNKILRNSPGRGSVYYKLGRISAKKGFTNDAKQNYLEYADRMQKAGQMDEAFRALKEFADLCPDQDDIRLMLADQLVKNNRSPEAIEQLQLLYAKLESEGRSAEARAAVDRMKALDPAVQPRQPTGGRSEKSSELVFLDLGYDAPPPPAARGRTPGPSMSDGATPGPAPGMLPPEVDVASGGMDRNDLGLIRATPRSNATQGDDALVTDPGQLTPDMVSGFQHTTFDVGGSLDAGMPPIGLEPTSLMVDTTHGASSLVPELDSGMAGFGIGTGVPGEMPMLDIDGHDLTAGGELQLILPEDAPPISLTPKLDAGPGGDVVIRSEQSLDASAGLEIRLEDSAFLGAPAGDVTAAGAPPSGGDLPLIEVHGADSLQPREPVPPAVHVAPALSVDGLREAVRAEPERWELHKRLAEALLDAGNRAEGIRHLELAMDGFDRAGDLRGAVSIVDEILRVEPNSVTHHQKRVEYAFRLNDKPRLAQAYLELADCLFRTGQEDKARAVYQRVLDLTPDDVRARMALETFADAAAPGAGAAGAALATPAPAAPLPFEVLPTARTERSPAAPSSSAPPPASAASPTPAASATRGSGTTTTGSGPRVGPPPRPSAKKSAPGAAPRGASSRAEATKDRASRAPAPKSSPAAPGGDESFVNLSSWLNEDDAPRSTRMKAQFEEPVDQEQVDFADMLAKFKEGVAKNVDEGDHQSHYDLGVAYKEMGLLDEAIAEFQKALRGSEHRVRTYEALGQCFIEKGQFQIARTVLQRALTGGEADEMLVGVLYLLGQAAEALSLRDEAMGYYERVFAVDIQFRDVGERLAAIERIAQ